MPPEQQWSIFASIAQVIQAVVVIVGIPLVVLQVRQMRTERRHRQWEALGWALSLLQQDTEVATLILRERLDPKPRYTHTNDDARSILIHLSGNLTVVQVAIDQSYVDQELLFTSIGHNLARLHMLISATKLENVAFGPFASAFANLQGMKLLETARIWHDAREGRPAPSMSQVMRYETDEQGKD